MNYMMNIYPKLTAYSFFRELSGNVTRTYGKINTDLS